MLHAHHHNRIQKKVFLAVAVLFSYTQSAVCQQDSIDILQSQLQTTLQQLKQAKVFTTQSRLLRASEFLEL